MSKNVNNEWFLFCNDWIFKKLIYIIGIPVILFFISITIKEYHLLDKFLYMSTIEKYLTFVGILIVLFFIYALNRFSTFLRRKVVNFFKNQGEFKA